LCNEGFLLSLHQHDAWMAGAQADRAWHSSAL
jgi:hypothetical protein